MNGNFRHYTKCNVLEIGRPGFVQYMMIRIQFIEVVARRLIINKERMNSCMSAASVENVVDFGV